MVPFNEWIEVDSIIEGHFMEVFIPGSMDKTYSDGRARMRAILHHGREFLKTMVIGKITDLHADAEAGYYEVELFDGLPQMLIEGLEADQYGTSMKYDLVRPDYRQIPGKSATNPSGLAELRVLEARVIEFGPTPFSHYEGTSAALRSMTDDTILAQLAEDPERLKALAERSGISLAGLDFVGQERTTTLREYKRATQHTRAVEYVSAAIWEIHPAALQVIAQILAERQHGEKPTPEEIRERIGTRERAESSDVQVSESVAVLSLEGPIIPKANLFSEVSGATSLQEFQGQFREAVASADVAAILLNVDSPGGSSELVQETTTEILKARGTKPIVAVANTWMASAAYHIASAADEIVVTPSGEVGSIGVITMHEDISAMQEKLGVKTTLVSAGKYKTERWPTEALSEEATAEMQASVDATYNTFVKDVAKGRGVPVKTVEADFGQGRMVMAEKAVELGMADRVGTFDETLARLEKLKPTSPVDRAAALEERAPERSDATTPAQPRRSTRQPRNYLEKEKPRWQL
jgi:signal peptide peptidase SppA